MKLIFFSGMTNAEVLHQVEHGYRMPCPPGCPDTLYNIMLECWNKDPMKRPTFETLQWKLEDFFTMEGSEYKEASAYWIENFELSLYIKKYDSCAVILIPVIMSFFIDIFMTQVSTQVWYFQKGGKENTRNATVFLFKRQCLFYR